MYPVATSALAALLAAAVVGCGGGSDGPEDSSDAARVNIEATLDSLLLPDPDLRGLCEVLSPRQLKESYGRDEPLQRCLMKMERREGAGLVSYEGLQIEADCARVEAVDQSGEKGLVFLREIDGEWLINDLEDPSTPSDNSDAVCGVVPLFGDQAG